MLRLRNVSTCHFMPNTKILKIEHETLNFILSLNVEISSKITTKLIKVLNLTFKLLPINII